MEWNDETIGQLMALWSEGHSTAEIGRRMNVSKNAVVGKAHRLNLPARPSPIRRGVTGEAPARPPALRRLVGPTLPPLATALPAPPRPVAVSAAVSADFDAPPVAIAIAVEPRLVAVAPAPPVRPAPLPPAARSARFHPCCWPIGEPGTKGFRFCDAEATAGKPYCSEHAQLAYVKVRDRRDEAAA
jgi:GcrA cell cycle regulator